MLFDENYKIHMILAHDPLGGLTPSRSNFLAATSSKLLFKLIIRLILLYQSINFHHLIPCINISPTKNNNFIFKNIHINDKVLICVHMLHHNDFGTIIYIRFRSFNFQKRKIKYYLEPRKS